MQVEPRPIQISEDQTPCDVMLVSLFDTAPHGLFAIAGRLREKGLGCKVVLLGHYGMIAGRRTGVEDAVTARALSDLRGLVAEKRPRIIGVTVRSPLFRAAIKVAADIRRNHHSCCIVFGGPHATLMPEACTAHADVVCRGEGEVAMIKIAEEVLGDPSGSELPAKDRASRPSAVFEPATPITDLDSLPYPSFDHGCLHTAGFSRRLLERRQRYYIMASRGCPFSCNYCNKAALERIAGLHGRTCRVRSPAHVVGELVAALRSFPRLKAIRFQDDVFPVDADWQAEFATLYRSKVGLPFSIFTAPGVLRETHVVTLKNAGLVEVSYGVQSGRAQTRRDLYGRPFSDCQMINDIKMLQSQEVRLNVHFIVDNPLETAEDHKATFEFLMRVSPPILKVSFFPLLFLPRSELSERLVASGVLSREDLAEGMVGGGRLATLSLGERRPSEALRWLVLCVLRAKTLESRWLRSVVPDAVLCRLAAGGPLSRALSGLVGHLARARTRLAAPLTGLRMFAHGEVE